MIFSTPGICRFEDETFCSPFSRGGITSVWEYNPSILSIIEPPYFGLILPTSLQVDINNNTLFIVNPRYLFGNINETDYWINLLLQESFDLEDQSPETISEILGEKLHKGIQVNTKLLYPLFSMASNRHKNLGWAIKSKFCVKGFMNVPGSVFKAIFSHTDGIQPGNTLSFGEMYAYVEALSEIHFSLGGIFKRGRQYSKNSSIHCSWGLGIVYTLGHSFAELETQKGDVSFSHANTLSLNGMGTITTAGTGLSDNYQLQNPFTRTIPIHGHGIGVSGGCTFFNYRSSLSVNLLRLGAMYWYKNVLQSKLTIQDDSLFLTDFFDDTTPLLKSESFKKITSFTRLYETTLSIEYSFRWESFGADKALIKKISDYRLINIGYLQPLVKHPIFKPTPGFSLAFENGFFYGYFPCQIGWSFDAREKATSFIQCKQVGSGLSFSINYRAISDCFFRWHKGMEVGIKTHVYIVPKKL